MATVPLSGTNIRLLSGVPFANDYKHTRWFDSLSQQTSYFDGLSVLHSMTQANFQRIEGKNFISMNKSIDELWSTNYLMFQNAQYNNKWFYAFVTKLEYVQKNTTYVHFEIDVLQTWRFEMNFMPSYVVREHCKLWNTDGTPVINTVDEGLNYGNEYDTVYSWNYEPPNGIFYLVIVAKSSLQQINGKSRIKSSLNGSPQPLCYYIHPFRMDGTNPDFWDGTMREVYETVPVYDNSDPPKFIGYEDVFVGYEADVKELTNIKDVLAVIFSQTNAVNNIVSMYVTEHIGYDIEYDSSEDAIKTNTDFEVITVTDVDRPELGTISTVYVENLPRYLSTELNIGEKYFGFNSVTESKLLMYPYSLTILDDFKGNRMTLKNEYIDNQNLYIRIMGSLGLNNKVAYIPRDYNTGNLIGIDQKTRVALETSLINNNAQDVPILAEMLSAFLQGNRNSLENQKNSIMFNGLMDIFGGAIGGAASAATGSATGLAASGTGMIKGAGNTVLQLQAMQAKQKDIGNTPPQLSKMGSNTAFDYGNGYQGFYVIKKQIKPEYRKKLEDFFKMYGYKVNEVKIPNFHTRQSWNFVQTNSCNIVGSFNNEDLQELKNIFDNGITLWHTNSVGNYSLGNGVIA